MDYTKGPWILNGDIENVNGECVATPCEPGITFPNDADIPLILAAPEMCEALKSCLEWCETIEDEESRLPLDVKMHALNVLSKAEGSEKTGLTPDKKAGLKQIMGKYSGKASLSIITETKEV